MRYNVELHCSFHIARLEVEKMWPRPAFRACEADYVPARPTANGLVNPGDADVGAGVSPPRIRTLGRRSCSVEDCRRYGAVHKLPTGRQALAFCSQHTRACHPRIQFGRSSTKVGQYSDDLWAARSAVNTSTAEQVNGFHDLGPTAGVPWWWHSTACTSWDPRT
jgi:hypothetical protein